MESMVVISKGETGVVPVGFTGTDTPPPENRWIITGANSDQGAGGSGTTGPNGFKVTYSTSPADATVEVPFSANQGACNLEIRTPFWGPPAHTDVYDGSFQVDISPLPGSYCHACEQTP